ncbi:MAG: diguanylate cyclase [Dehalococcoidia bacterium]|nr:diguanylate cyclase [Dehalococcoidia bacterium]
MQRAEAQRKNRRVLLGTLGVVGAAEVVATVAMPPLGAVLLGATGAAAWLTRRNEKLAEAQHASEVAQLRDNRGDAGLVDIETGLPNRQHLIDQVAREVARSERYSQELTVGIVEIMRLQELQQVWGDTTVEKAVMHVADTLKRVVRTSDFLARLDAQRFAVVLLGCNLAQAQVFGDRVNMAVSNRPLQARENGRLPVYVNVSLSAMEYEPGKFRGPMDFISAAGGEVDVFEAAPRPVAGVVGEPLQAVAVAAPQASPRRSADPQSLRRQLVRDYYPDGKSDDFATAWGKFRSKAS